VFITGKEMFTRKLQKFDICKLGVYLEKLRFGVLHRKVGLTHCRRLLGHYKLRAESSGLKA